MSSSICLISLLLFKNAEEGGRLGAGQRRHLQALWGILWQWKAVTFRCLMGEHTVHSSLWPLLFSRMAWCANFTRDVGCSHINITESSLGPRAFFHVFEKRLEEPLHLCLLWGQVLAKSKVIIVFFFPCWNILLRVLQRKMFSLRWFWFSSLRLGTISSITVLQTMQVKVQLDHTAPFFSQTHTLFLPLKTLCSVSVLK